MLSGSAEPFATFKAIQASAVYQRHDWAGEKRSARDAWADHVLAIAEQRTPATTWRS
jgi:hypothetical protein